MLNCKVCKNELFLLLHYENMPKAAQGFPYANELDDDHGIDLDIYQCSGCGLVQLITEPVPYYWKAIRSESAEMKSFRQRQLDRFIKRFKLDREKIIEITEEPKDEILKNISFEAFLMFNFLEHLPDPNRALCCIHYNLIGSGMGIVEVPNFNLILRKKIVTEFIRDHLFYFSAQTLRTTLELNGFNVLSIKEIWDKYILSAIVKRRDPLYAPDFYDATSALKSKIRRHIRGKTVAVWGAGHQALTALSLFDLKDKVSYVVDSSLFKQGKYTFVTHLPIVAPLRLKTDPVDIILVMVAGYTQEVLDQINAMGLNSSIIVLNGSNLEVLKL